MSDTNVFIDLATARAAGGAAAGGTLSAAVAGAALQSCDVLI